VKEEGKPEKILSFAMWGDKNKVIRAGGQLLLDTRKVNTGACGRGGVQYKCRWGTRNEKLKGGNMSVPSKSNIRGKLH